MSFPPAPKNTDYVLARPEQDKERTIVAEVATLKDESGKRATEPGNKGELASIEQEPQTEEVDKVEWALPGKESPTVYLPRGRITTTTTSGSKPDPTTRPVKRHDQPEGR